MVALLAEGVDRNLVTKGETTYDMSVALLAEGVDRNDLHPGRKDRDGPVALLAEGVDRNVGIRAASIWPIVALLAEGVDRNYRAQCTALAKNESPSSRRAWIEIGAIRRAS